MASSFLRIGKTCQLYPKTKCKHLLRWLIFATRSPELCEKEEVTLGIRRFSGVTKRHLQVIGGGLAGSEAAWQAANLGISVTLYEMRPERPTPAHHTNSLAELVCSNSLGAAEPNVASGLLKAEMARLSSLIFESAYANRVPAGGALAVDRIGFAEMVTARIEAHPLIELRREHFPALDPEVLTIMATGPLTTQELSTSLMSLTGEKSLHFFDAAAPILDIETVDREKVFVASRYDKDAGSYVNCPMTKEEYEIFWNAITTAEVAPVKDFDDVEANAHFFEGCLPVEVIAKRGIETLRFGPMKPVGLRDPRTDQRPYAVVQLRQDNAAGTLYNLVGFQTQLKWGEQKRVFRLIPGLENAEFVRFGVMHRNAYLNSPKILEQTLQLKGFPNLFVAGQLTGVEGYSESTAMGAIAGLNAARLLMGLDPVVPPETTMIGSLLRYITTCDARYFQPMNSNWGIIPSFEQKIRDKRQRNERYVERSLADLDQWLQMARPEVLTTSR